MTHINTALLQVDNKLRYINLRRNFVWERLVSFAEPTIWSWRDVDDFRGAGGQSRNIGSVLEGTGTKGDHALHASEVGFGVIDANGVLGEVNDWGVFAVGVFHAVSVLVT